ncbi:MAG: YdcH family protein [Pseudomonadota bacterium]|nr:YdcH family protein [Pseudomonadota bacterium]
MEATELEAINRLTASHDELRHLFGKHQDFERELGRLERIRYPSEAERREINRVKRLKLRGKDRIQSIIATHSEA